MKIIPEIYMDNDLIHSNPLFTDKRQRQNFRGYLHSILRYSLWIQLLFTILLLKLNASLNWLYLLRNIKKTAIYTKVPMTLSLISWKNAYVHINKCFYKKKTPWIDVFLSI